mmetsp:Transcript_39187/g.79888  ORF Transcript_39187/g.79888 Transcript_39187/m.79888 type:complete len:292 (-) Transcript_39187:154-1029(-)|eukprot:CAMPEP_0183306568 /NCGR_PEP_ID=MMETSP0160_2-20130417/12736_1 /TAXON_ID=2839 ORGANISM="Odontella Sinensis, Strain Grunow 1884" /NCGR_SAMPLE_ID=MMETSP0160_2 /ASSEMBLY_ACC=CAM_ASM_000250 /LENGTH=291 /DNA_ID=CAMNT_0025469977 /DNA_START=41 /DNA_END=916 /DNA_ORIENTATION=+
MAEGGKYPWKVQKIDQSRGPPGDYTCISRGTPLPPPPSGYRWAKDADSGEWSIVGGAAVRVCAGSSDVAVEGERDGACPSPHPAKEAIAPDASKSSAEVEGVDYACHTVLPTDTFMGICLQYNIKPVQLRRANRFSGTNLRLAPSTLIIPLSKDGIDGGRIRLQDKNSKEYKTHAFLSSFPSMAASEAKAYLLMAGWDLDAALNEARSDANWEKSKVEEDEAKAKAAKTTQMSKGIDGACGREATPKKSTNLTLHVHVAIPATSSGEDVPSGFDEEAGLRTPLLIELPKIH